MSREWKTAAEAYSIETDQMFEYAKSWEEVQQIFEAGANHASEAYRKEIDKIWDCIKEIAEMPCCVNSKYPGCKACATIDLLVHADRYSPRE